MKPELLRDKLSQAIASAAVAQQDLHFLALSGGGQWGAFGAGFLKGWSEAGTRPAFQIVTGTSTGSLIATFAFLGSAHDDALADAYLGIRGNQDVFEDYFWLTLPFHNSMASTKPLRRRLETFMTPERVAQVAAEGRAGRQLFVGAARLHSGQFEALSLSEIAAQDPATEARRRYINALMASTAIPVKFPPVPVTDVEHGETGTDKGEVYVDGGVRRNIFFKEFLSTLRAHSEGGKQTPPRSVIYCIVNGRRRVGPAQVSDWLIPIARRSVTILLNESTEGNLFRICLQAERRDVEFRVVSIDPQTCADLPGMSDEDDFNPEVMRCLYDAGRRLARENPDPWSRDPLDGSA